MQSGRSTELTAQGVEREWQSQILNLGFAGFKDQIATSQGIDFITIIR